MLSLILFIKGMFSPYVFRCFFVLFFGLFCEELAVVELFAVKKKLIVNHEHDRQNSTTVFAFQSP